MENKIKDLTKMSSAVAFMFSVYWIYNFFISEYLPASGYLRAVISLIVLYVVGFGLLLFITKDITENEYKKEKLTFKTAVICFFLQFSAFVVSALVRGLIIFITKKIPNEDNYLTFPMLFSLLFLAPVLEELIFRYIFGKKLLKYGPSFYMLISSFCFCIVHGVSVGVATVIYTFLLGLIWSYLIVKTKNIVVTIIYHSLSNFFGGILPQIIVNASEQLFSIYFIIIIVCAVAGLVLFLINKKEFTVDEKIFSCKNLRELFTNKGIVFLISATIIFMFIKSMKI
ncbi:MAG: CPBP family intramembrane glutamic endopeptidase [Erysipelotrichaceae bacterium]|jgi:membrane protease YdiL (CAAX protease family)